MATSRNERRLAVGLGAGVLLPLLVLAAGIVAQRAQPMYPAGDLALLELYTRRALDAEQLLGPYSRFGWSHPGPALFYLFAPFYALTGRTAWSLYLGALGINIAAVVLLLFVVRRIAGHVAFYVASVIVAAYVLLLDLHVASPWNPHVTILPLAAFVVVAWAVSTGRMHYLPAAVAVGSFLAQTHVAYLPTVAFVGGAAVVFTAASAADEGWRRAAARWSKWAAAALVVGFVAWIPPLVEQIRAGPGNLVSLVRFFADGGGTFEPLTTRLGAAARALVIVPLGVPLDPARPSAATLAIAAVLVASLVFAAWVAGPPLRRLCLISLAAVAAVVFSATRIEGAIHPFLVMWMGSAGAVAWIAIGSVAAQRVNESRWWIAVPALAIAAAAAAGTSDAVSLLPDVDQGLLGGNEPVVRALADPVREAASGADGVLVDIVTEDVWPVAAGVVLQLDKAAIDVSLERSWVFMFGRRTAPTGAEESRLAFAGPRERGRLSAESGAMLVASAEGTHAFLQPRTGRGR